MISNKFLFRNVIISPFLTPFSYWKEPTFFGSISAANNYTTHLTWSRPASRYAFTRSYKFIFEQSCILGQFILPSWGHFITESLNNLYLIKKLDLKLPIIFLAAPYNNKPLADYQKQLYKLLGINQDIFVLNDTTLFKNIYMAPPGLSINGHQLKEQIAALGIISPSPIPGKKLYISRSKIKKGRCINEEAVENILLDRGWHIIRPEELPVCEQLEHMATADTIFAISGSAIHSLLLLKDVPQRVIIYPRIHTHTYNQVAKAKCHDYWLLDIPHECVKPNPDPSQEDYSFDLSFFVDTLIRSNDFSKLNPIRDRIRLPANPDPDFQIMPEIYNGPKPKAGVSANLFYRVLLANTHSRGILNALRIIMTLIKRQLLESYMAPACQQFLDKFYPESANAFRNMMSSHWSKGKMSADNDLVCLQLIEKDANSGEHPMENKKVIPALIKLS